MKLSGTTKIHDLLEKFPFLIEFLAAYNPKFGMLRNQAMRATLGRLATLQQVAGIGGLDLSKLLGDLKNEILKHSSEPVELETGTPQDPQRLEHLKEIIKALHAGEDLESAKQRFRHLLKDVKPEEIKDMEESLLRQGMPVQEIQRLCDLHVGVFKPTLDTQEQVAAPSGHPVHTYRMENKVLQETADEFDCLLKTLGEPPSAKRLSEIKEPLVTAFAKLAQVEKHYVRKENRIFPYLEKHGVTAPPQVMWGVHNEIRGLIKAVRLALEQGDAKLLMRDGMALLRAVVEMIYKEEKILFPLLLSTFSPEEWVEIRKGEDELGYIFVSPGKEWLPGGEDKPTHTSGEALPLSTGNLTLEQINLLLTHLPLDISFVDENDQVQYYSEGPERIFPRSPGVIGRRVQQCHPPKSVHMVEQILQAFKSGHKDSAEFWIPMQGKMVYIRYLAVRDAKGTYRGTLELTQDISGIQKLGGEKRLLDWKE